MSSEQPQDQSSGAAHEEAYVWAIKNLSDMARSAEAKNLQPRGVLAAVLKMAAMMALAMGMKEKGFAQIAAIAMRDAEAKQR